MGWDTKSRVEKCCDKNWCDKKWDEITKSRVEKCCDKNWCDKKCDEILRAELKNDAIKIVAIKKAMRY